MPWRKCPDEGTKIGPVVSASPLLDQLGDIALVLEAEGVELEAPGPAGLPRGSSNHLPVRPPK